MSGGGGVTTDTASEPAIGRGDLLEMTWKKIRNGANQTLLSSSPEARRAEKEGSAGKGVFIAICFEACMPAQRRHAQIVWRRPALELAQ